MARVLVTGSADGLGLMAAKLLANEGHRVTLHARNEQRAMHAKSALAQAEDVVIGDLANLAGMRQVVDAANASGRFDAIIHNAAVGYREPRRIETVDGLSALFAVNVLAPYLLTVLIEMPSRLVYLSSGLHRQGKPSTEDLQWDHRKWDGAQAYCDSKLFDAVLSAAVARKRSDVFSNTLEPGWVATKMGGRGATDDLSLAPITQAWLAVSSDPEALVSGAYFCHQRPRETHEAVGNHEVRDELLDRCGNHQFATSHLRAIGDSAPS